MKKNHHPLNIIYTAEGAILHWGIYKAMFGPQWFHPPKTCYLPGSKEMNEMTIQTPF